MYSEKASIVFVFICNPQPHPPVYLQKIHSYVFIFFMHHIYLCNRQKYRLSRGKVTMSKKKVMYKRQTRLMTQ